MLAQLVSKAIANATLRECQATFAPVAQPVMSAPHGNTQIVHHHDSLSSANSRHTAKSPKAVVRWPYPCAEFQGLATFWTRNAARYKRSQALRSEMNA